MTPAATPRKIVAVDTHCVSWAMRPARTDDTPHTQEMRIRARILFSILDEEKARIVLPCVAVAELLVPISKEHRAEFISRLNAQFICASLDLPASTIAADLWEHHKSFAKEDRYKDRPLLKSDLQLIASAKASGATILYSHDVQCRKVAAHVMEARDLPKKHPDMFLDKELRELK